MFYELLDNSQRIEPGRLQLRARQRFPTLVQKSDLQQALPGDPRHTSNKSRYLILGVATYSPDDLRLLDEVESSHAQWEQHWNVAVFDVMECKDMADVRQFTPQ